MLTLDLPVLAEIREWHGSNSAQLLLAVLPSQPSLLGDCNNNDLSWYCCHAVWPGQLNKWLITTSLTPACLCHGITCRRKDLGEFLVF
jgi:hypothetical protein